MDPNALLVGDQLSRHFVHAPDLFGRRQTVIARGGDAGADHPFQTGDPHHVEFVEVRGRDREKFQSLEQRVTVIAAFFQDAAIKREP